MNIFAKSSSWAKAAKHMGMTIEAVQQAVAETKTEGGQETRGSPEGKASRDMSDEDYDNFGWVRDKNVISAGHWKSFTTNFADAVERNYFFNKTLTGELMIEAYNYYDTEGVADVIVFAKGTIESPIVTQIIKINLKNDQEIENARLEIYALERRGVHSKAGGVLNIYTRANTRWISNVGGSSYQNASNNNQLGAKRSRSEITANPIVKSEVNEDAGTVTVTYKNGDVVTEPWGKGKASRELDTEYLTAVENGDMETAQRMVDEAAKVAGYKDTLYHGTKNFGFTEFDASRSDDKISFFVTGSEDIAQSYSGKYGSMKISDLESYDNKPLHEVVKKLREVSQESYEGKQLNSQYKIMSMTDVNSLIMEVNDGIEKLKNTVNEKIKDYAEILATDFNDSDYKTHGYLVKLKGLLDNYSYSEMSTPIYILLHKTEAFDRSAQIADLEYKIRLMNRLANKDTSNGVVVEKQLDGYGIALYTPDEARAALKEHLSSGNYKLYGNPGNQLVIDGEGRNWNKLKNWQNSVKKTTENTYVKKENGNYVLYDKATDKVIEGSEVPLNQYNENLSIETMHGILVSKENNRLAILTEGKTTTRDIAKFAKDNGYDSVKFENIEDSGGRGNEAMAGDVYAYFSSSNLKSADPVTYDDNGKIIPLSERFNPENKDIRYSRELDLIDYINEQAGKENDDSLTKTQKVAQVRGELERMNVGSGEIMQLQSVADKLFDVYGGESSISEFRYGMLEATKLALDSKSESFDKAYEIVQSIAREVAYNPKNVGGEAELLREIKAEIRGSKMAVHEADKTSGEFDRYGGYGAFRQSNFGKFMLANDGIQVDAKYEELRNQYGDAFFPEVNTVSEQLMQMAKLMDTPLSEYMWVSLEELDATADEMVNTLFSKLGSIWDKAVKAGKPIVTVADDSISNRELLANALESTVKHEVEAKKLAEYKERINELNEQSVKLAKMRAEIYELMRSLTINGEKISVAKFEKLAKEKAKSLGLSTKNITYKKTDGTYSALVDGKEILSADRVKRTEEQNAKLKALSEEAQKTENRIHFQDRKLLQLESTSALKGVVDRERAAAYKAAAEKGREALHKNVEGRHKTAEKQAIRGIAKDLEKLLNRGTKERNIKQGERGLIEKVLELTDMLYASDDELLLNGIGTEFTKAEAEAMDDYMNLYDKYHSYDNAVTANKEIRAELRQEMAELKKQFEGVLERERKRISEAKASGIFDAIVKEYEGLNKSEEAYIKQAYKPEVAEYLKQMKDTIGDANLADMSLEQLKALHKAMSLVKHLVQDSNKLFRNGKRESIETRRDAIFSAIDALKNKYDKDYPEIIGKALDKINELGWNNLRPVDAFELTDAEALIELYWDVISAQNTYAKDVEEAKAAIVKARETHGYAKWNLDNVTSFKTEDGRSFNVTLGEMMSIYAYSKREQADKHMREGGFQHEKKAFYKDSKGVYRLRKKEALTYKISDKMRFDIINALTKEQRAYVDEMQKVLTEWGEKGNEASRIIYGIDLFTEEIYFPLQSSSDYLSSASTELGKTVTTASLSATGMAKATIPGASNPIILRGFDEVVLEHFDKMAKYHSYLVPIDNLRKMLDAQGKDNNNNIVSTKALIGNKLGDGASKYFQDYITDLNGGMNIGGAKNPLESFFGKSKAMSVMANISVWVQQYFSIVRAFCEVNPKYFIPFMGESFKKADMKLYEEMKKYAPITTIKEMGGFDVGSNRSIQDFVGYEGTGKAKGKAWKKFQDMLGVGAEFMDKLGWMTIWKGVKKEVAASGNYKTGSDEYFKACGERFERIIAKTQVYDSVNSKSAYMRSKNPAVKYLVSFMGEPTTILGMAEVSIIRFERAVESGDKAKIKEASGKLAGTMAAIAVSTALTSVAKSLVYALRDDDEDETYFEKYAQALGKAFVDDINIFKYIPVARDIVSAWEGFTTERPDMTLLQDAIDSIKKVMTEFNDEESTVEEMVNAHINAALAIGNIFGIPAKNIYRDIKGLVNTIANIGNGYRTDFGEKFAEGLFDTSKNKSEKLYDAIISGDENLTKYYQSTYKDFSAYKTALRKTLRENDERIKEAAEAKNSGDIETYESILQEIINEGNFDSVIIEEAIEAEANSYYSDLKSDEMRIIESVMATMSGDNKKRIEIEKALVDEGKFTVDLISKARQSEMNSLNNLLKEAKELIARGRHSDAEAIYNDLIKKGYTKEFIEAQKNKK